MSRRASPRRIVRGDWQTPVALAERVVELVARLGPCPRTVIEPTCGEGRFLQAAARRWPRATLRGWELDPDKARRALATLGDRAHVEVADFFTTPWEAIASDCEGPVLLLGNPPWVTNAEQGALRSSNLPVKTNHKKLAGLDARTGRANFDVSEWMIQRLLDAFADTRWSLAMLCKSLVARRLLERASQLGRIPRGQLFDIDAHADFEASVDAVLLHLRPPAPETAASAGWARFSSFDDEQPRSTIGAVDGTLVGDLQAHRLTRAFEGQCEPAWRSGLKHDCAAVMELQVVDGQLRHRSGERVDLEPDHVFPLLKGSDVANDRWPPTRAVVVPQRAVGQDTRTLATTAPRTWAYLSAHRAALDARRSSVHRGQPPFSVFGVGPYTFAPWKVAVAGLYKRLAFMLVGPHEGRPVVVDDTTYFLPFEQERDARVALTALRDPLATAFFGARIFWDDKRPITKRVLQSLDLVALAAHRARGSDAHTAERSRG